MIRDPSDGSVREKHNEAIIDRFRGVPANPENWKGKFDPQNPNVPQANDNLASGLPTGSTKPENLARLEKSREWLKQYRKAVDDVNRMNDKEEIPNDAT